MKADDRHGLIGAILLALLLAGVMVAKLADRISPSGDGSVDDSVMDDDGFGRRH